MTKTKLNKIVSSNCRVRAAHPNHPNNNNHGVWEYTSLLSGFPMIRDSTGDIWPADPGHLSPN